MHDTVVFGGLELCSRIVGVAGYVAASMYKKMEGDRWVWNINLTSCLFAGEMQCLL